jgi:hypothetical protein
MAVAHLKQTVEERDTEIAQLKARLEVSTAAKSYRSLRTGGIVMYM